MDSIVRFSYSFVMNESTDLNARVAINAGTSAENIYLDSITLKMDVQSNISDRYQTDNKFLLHPNYPNPFSSSKDSGLFSIVSTMLPTVAKLASVRI